MRFHCYLKLTQIIACIALILFVMFDYLYDNTNIWTLCRIKSLHTYLYRYTVLKQWVPKLLPFLFIIIIFIFSWKCRLCFLSWKFNFFVCLHYQVLFHLFMRRYWKFKFTCTQYIQYHFSYNNPRWDCMYIPKNATKKEKKKKKCYFYILVLYIQQIFQVCMYFFYNSDIVHICHL